VRLGLWLAKAGRDDAERHGVHADPDRAPLVGKRLCQADDPGLGRRVIRRAGAAERRRKRGDHHDLAIALGIAITFGGGAEVGVGGPAQPERRQQVNVEHRLELLVGHRPHGRVPVVSGVVDDDVQPPERLDDAFDDASTDWGIGQVTGDGNAWHTEALDDVGGSRLIDIRHAHMGAIGGQRARGGSADALTRAGDDGHLAGEGDQTAASVSWAWSRGHR